MPKIYLLGGENVPKKSAQPINEAAFEDVAKSPNVLVFPWARPSFDLKYGKRKLLSDYLFSFGAGAVNFAEYGEAEGISDKLAQTDMVYLSGGQASILIERNKKAGVDQLLRNYRGVIVGRSAGALALCSRCVTTCRYNSKVRVVEGLGLVDITLKTHYLPEKDEALKKFSLEETIYAVPINSALVCKDGHLSAIGSVYVFQGGQRQNFTEANL